MTEGTINRWRCSMKSSRWRCNMQQCERQKKSGSKWCSGKQRCSQAVDHQWHSPQQSDTRRCRTSVSGRDVCARCTINHKGTGALICIWHRRVRELLVVTTAKGAYACSCHARYMYKSTWRAAVCAYCINTCKVCVLLQYYALP